MRNGINRTKRGFTLVEVLAGMMFMAIVLPVAIEGISISHRVGVVSERKREAGRLAQMILDEAIATGTWRDGDQNKDFGEDWPGYSWSITSAEWIETGITEVTAEVFFTVMGREYSVALSTLTQTEETTSDSTSGTSSGTSSTRSSATGGTGTQQ